jgi:hypothetical protein
LPPGTKASLQESLRAKLFSLFLNLMQPTTLSQEQLPGIEESYEVLTVSNYSCKGELQCLVLAFAKSLMRKPSLQRGNSVVLFSRDLS